MYQIAKRNARLHLALKAHQHRFRHIERHHASRGSKRHQARARRERNPDRETGVGVAAGADGIRQQHTVQPGVDHAVARTQRHAAAVHDEVRQGVVRGDVNRLRIRRRVAEGLHHEIGGEAEARQVFQFITGHRAGGVLGPHGGHFRLAIRTRTDTRDAAGATHHFLRQRVATVAFSHIFRVTEHVAVRQAQRFTRFGGQAAADDQRNTTARAYFVDQHVGFQFKIRQQFAGFVVAYFAAVRVDVNHIAHVQV
ncbi:hypothetical protein BN131_435 [Cronobacter malonaticus 681]|nr:hypothetical protein BN131_435 [Cronobacter malonaticus 681]